VPCVFIIFQEIPMLTHDVAIYDEVHYCPHCKEKLTCCDAPPFHVGDGLGWGSEVLFICLNDDCPLFVRGWQHIEQQFAHSSSYRYMLVPGEKTGTAMMVASKDAFKGCIVDIESLKMQNRRYAEEKEALAQLDTCVAEGNLQPVLNLVLNEAAAIAGREQACDLICELNDLSCIDPIRNHTFSNEAFEHRVNMAVSKLLQQNYKIECPHCAEIVKKQAKVCMHCGKELMNKE